MPRHWPALLILLYWAAPVWAARVELPIAPHVVGVARFDETGSTASPVLILHGFLQTSGFSTVQHLHDALAQAGYTVLSPTLSLGIDRRQHSLSCGALHLHTLGGDAAELGKWVDWLYQRFHKPVVLIGQSTADLVLTRYLHDNPHAPVAKLILIGLAQLRGVPLSHLSGSPIQEYSLGFCKRYPSTSRGFLSYADWSADQVLRTLAAHAAISTVILAADDQRLKPQWVNQLITAGVPLVVIQGAGNFFDGRHQAELLTAVKQQLRALNQ